MKDLMPIHETTPDLVPCSVITGRPIFIHTTWRTSGTYLWAALRGRPDILGFYEPFHEILAELTPKIDQKVLADAGSLRHANVNQPYFDEYPTKRRGVRFYRRDFAYRNYFNQDAGQAARERRYVDYLIDTASASSKTAVLKFCRGAGRIDRLVRDHPGLHLYVVRDAARQWRSFLSSGHGYFRTALVGIFAMNPDAPLVQRLAPFLALPNYRTGRYIDGEYNFYNAFQSHLSDEQAEFLFRLYWYHALVMGAACADAVVDAGEIDRSAVLNNAEAEPLAELIKIWREDFRAGSAKLSATVTERSRRLDRLAQRLVCEAFGSYVARARSRIAELPAEARTCSPLEHVLELGEHDGREGTADNDRDWLGADWGLAPLSAFLSATWNNGRMPGVKSDIFVPADRFKLGSGRLGQDGCVDFGWHDQIPATPGNVVHGPYISLDAGSYVATIEGSILGRFVVDMKMDHAVRFRRATVSNGNQEVRFRLARPVTRFEFAIEATDQSRRLQFYRLRLRQVGA